MHTGYTGTHEIGKPPENSGGFLVYLCTCVPVYLCTCVPVYLVYLPARVLPHISFDMLNSGVISKLSNFGRRRSVW